MGQKEATEIICGNPWNLLYQDGNTYDTDISEEKNCTKDYVLLNIRIAHMSNVTLTKE